MPIQVGILVEYKGIEEDHAHIPTAEGKLKLATGDFLKPFEPIFLSSSCLPSCLPWPSGSSGSPRLHIWVTIPAGIIPGVHTPGSSTQAYSMAPPSCDSIVLPGLLWTSCSGPSSISSHSWLLPPSSPPWFHLPFPSHLLLPCSVFVCLIPLLVSR